MLTRDEIRKINAIIERATREGLITKHHRYSLAAALEKLKESYPLDEIASSPAFSEIIERIRS